MFPTKKVGLFLVSRKSVAITFMLLLLQNLVILVINLVIKFSLFKIFSVLVRELVGILANRVFKNPCLLADLPNHL